MTQHKFITLADRLTQRRIESMEKLYRPKTETPPPHRRQLKLDFLGEEGALEVFHRFDSKSREVEWSYYTKEGCFLLQFGFCLVDQSYRIYTLHPALFQADAVMQGHLEAINQNLKAQFPSLKLICSQEEGPSIQVMT